MHQTLTTPPIASQETKKRRLRRRRYIILGSIGLVLLLIIGSVVASKREKPIPVTTETAVRKTILQTVSATGKIQPETEVKISPEVAGEIIELPVEDGKAVKKGDLLVKIKPDSYKALLEQQEAAISAAKATNLQQKATMVKTEQDLNTTPRRPRPMLRKTRMKVHCMKSNVRKRVRARRAINFPRRRFIHRSMGR
jgi:HlyD family secretion protein